jgi:two-component system chemotaxis sensor kinase CheA
VSIDTLDQLMTMVSELALTRNQLLEVLRRHDDSEFNVPLQRLSSVTTQVQQEVMKTRMQPIGNAWQKLPRIVRDLSVDLGKDIGLEMVGADTELDRQVLDLVKDPLTHLVRNCADHGIENPDERTAAGKLRRGTIRLTASRQGGYVVIEIADDGRGLDTARIKAKALEAGLIGESEIFGEISSRDQQSHFRSGIFDRLGGHQHFRPWRRDGYCTQQYRTDWRDRRCEVVSWQRDELRYQKFR